MKLSKSQLGYLAEMYIQYQLALQGVLSRHIGMEGAASFSDLLLENGEFVEVKASVFTEERFKSTSNGSPIAGWGFGKLQRSFADYIVFVLFEKDYSVYKTFICKPGDYKSDTWSFRRPTQEQVDAVSKGPVRGESKPSKAFSENAVEFLVKELKD